MDNYQFNNGDLGGNPYGQQNTQSVNNPEDKKKKTKKIFGIIFLILGAALMLAGFGAVFFAGSQREFETGEPMDIYQAQNVDDYVFAPVQYMTDPVAYYEALDKLQFYIAFDNEWNPCVICLDDSDSEVFQPYIEWFYSDSEEGAPEQMSAIGYAQPFDDELRELVVEGFTDNMGEGYVDMENFDEWFGSYYIQVGQKNSSYGISNAGIYMMLGGIVVIVAGGAFLYDKKKIKENSDAYYMKSPEIPKTHTGLGILGALLGALLGGILWTVIAVWGYFSGWVGVLIIVFASMGYQILAEKSDLIGKTVSLIFGLLVIAPATYIYYVWTYYQVLNESVSGYTTFVKAFAEFPNYMTKYSEWGTFVGDMLAGYLFVGIAGIYMMISGFSARKRSRQNSQSLHQMNNSVSGNPYDRNSTQYGYSQNDTAWNQNGSNNNNPQADQNGTDNSRSQDNQNGSHNS